MKHFLRIGLPLLVLAGLVASAALPAAAADQPQVPAVKRFVPADTTGGEVTAIAADKTSFTIKPRVGDAVTIKVDANTRYFKTNPIPGPRASIQGLKNKLHGLGGMLQNLGKNIQRGLSNKGQTPAPQATPTPKPTPTAAELDQAFLARIEKTTQPATFGDIAIGDIALVRTAPNSNLAKYVVITKKPPVARVEGTITAVSANTITITPTGGQAVVLTWDKDTRFTIAGAITVKVGQTAIAVYNTETKKASVISVKAA